jgi:hypothetical protein
MTRDYTACGGIAISVTVLALEEFRPCYLKAAGGAVRTVRGRLVSSCRSSAASSTYLRRILWRPGRETPGC